MRVQMPDGTIIDGVPEGASKAEVLYKYRQSQIEPEYQPAVSGPLEATAIGAGGLFNRLGAGARNLAAMATGNEQTQADIAVEQAEARRLEEPVREQYPVATTVGEMLPGLATAPLSGGLLTQMGIGAGLGAAEYSQNQGMGGLLGAGLSGLGYGAGQLIGKGANVVNSTRKVPTEQRLTGLTGDMVKKADNLGMQLRPGDISGSRQMRRIDVGIERNPATADLLEDALDNNQRILNRTAMEAMGESGDEIGENTLAEAAARIGKVYDDVLSNVDELTVNPVNIQLAVDDMAQDSLPYIERYLRDFPNLQNGRITGREAGRLRNRIQKDIRLVRKSGRADPDDLSAFQDLILDAAEQAGGADRSLLHRAGQEWRIMKALERGETVTSGNVNPRSLRTGLKQYDTRFRRGLLENQTLPDDLQRLYDATRVSTHFKNVVGDPGTSTALQTAEFLDPRNFVQRQLMRRGARTYLETRNVPTTLNMLEGLQQPISPVPGQIGAALGRGLLGAY